MFSVFCFPLINARACEDEMSGTLTAALWIQPPGRVCRLCGEAQACLA